MVILAQSTLRAALRCEGGVLALRGGLIEVCTWEWEGFVGEE